MAEKRRIWIDCDPGIDDAVMLALAAVSREQLQICGISTVAGNQSSDLVTENALWLSEKLGLSDVPVARGARKPLIRQPEDAEAIHGADGLGNCRSGKADRREAPVTAILLMRRAIMDLPEGEKMTLVPTGPLTNIALLFSVFPEVMERIDQIVLMGGSAGPGNATKWAEFNIYVDPEAAQAVFTCGLPIVMCGLDLTTKCVMLPAQIEELAKSGSELRQLYGRMLAFYARTTFDQGENLCIHDACTVMYLLHPELFSGQERNVCVICHGTHDGQTVCTEGSAVQMLDSVDLPAYQKILLELLDRL